MNTRIKKSIILGLTFGLLNGIVQAVLGLTENPIFYGIFSGILFGVIMYFFNKPNVNIEITEGETDIYSGVANYYKKFIAIGGKLYLFDDKIKFNAHRFNIPNQGQEFNLNEINEVGYFNTLGILPNGLFITTKEGKREKFVVQEREIWKEKIESKLTKLKEKVD